MSKVHIVFKGDSYLVVPDLDESVISPRDEIGFVPTTIVVHTVDTFVMALQGKVRVV